MRKAGKPMILLIAMALSFGGIAQQPLTLNHITSDTGAPHIMDSTMFRPPLSDNRFRFRSIILPATLIAYGFVALENDGLRHLNSSTKAELREDHSAFITHADNYLQFTPAAAVYVLNIAGIKGKHNLRDRSVIYGLTTLLSTAIVFPLKKITHEERPDHSNFGSFPSGHTTMAFASAEFLRQEYKDVSPWYGVAGYAVAATTGALRMYNNKHWLSDVVAGAGFGVLSTKAVYRVYPWIQQKIFKEKPVTTMIMPYYQSGGAGLALVHHFQ
jgi:membrane-associated phospholipid phosphatase